MEFLRDASAADHAAPLQNTHAQARHAEISRTGEAVMTGSDYDGVEIGHFSIGLTCFCGVIARLDRAIKSG